MFVVLNAKVVFVCLFVCLFVLFCLFVCLFVCLFLQPKRFYMIKNVKIIVCWSQGVCNDESPLYNLE